MDWKQYEDEIFRHFQQEFPTARMVRDAHRQGRMSHVERQIDILVEDTIAGFEVRIAIDAKHRNKRIDVTDVEAFLGFCADIDANKGVMISLNGYTQAAANRAHHDESDIELDVLNFAELQQFQGFGAIPYAGSYGVVLPAPFGWIIDAERREGAIATLYQRGFNLAKAQRNLEWMYINFWVKKDGVDTLQKLLQHQEQYLLAEFPDAKITYRDGPNRELGVTKIRCFEHPSYPTPEYTGFVEFDGFIFFCVLFTPPEVANRNIRKLNYILRSVVPIRVRLKDPPTEATDAGSASDA